MRIHESKGVSGPTTSPHGTSGNSPNVGATNPTILPTRSHREWLYHNPEKNSPPCGPTAQSHTTTNYGSNYGDPPTVSPSIQWSPIETRLQQRYNSHPITCCPSGSQPSRLPTNSELEVPRTPCLEILIGRDSSVARPTTLIESWCCRTTGVIDYRLHPDRRPFESPLGLRTTPTCRGHCSRQ